MSSSKVKSLIYRIIITNLFARQTRKLSKEKSARIWICFKIISGISYKTMRLLRRCENQKVQLRDKSCACTGLYGSFLSRKRLGAMAVALTVQVENEPGSEGYVECDSDEQENRVLKMMEELKPFGLDALAYYLSLCTR